MRAGPSILALWAVTCAACGAQPGPAASQTAVEPSRASATPSAAKPRASDASRPTEAELPNPAASAPSFHVIESTNSLLRLHELGERTLVTGTGIFSVVDDAGLTPDPAAVKSLSLDASRRVSGVVGAWPAPLWVMVEYREPREGGDELFLHGSDAWTQLRGALPATTWYSGLSTWNDGRVLALEQKGDGPKPFSRFHLVAGAQSSVPALAPASAVPAFAALDPNDECRRWRTALIPHRFVALSSGHVFAVGKTCSAIWTAAEIWQPGQTRGKLHVFPESGPDSESWGNIVELVARAADDVHAFFDDGRIEHFDGSKWSSETMPFLRRLNDDRASNEPVVERAIKDVDVALDGTLFVIVEDLVLSKGRKGRDPAGVRPVNARRPGRLFRRPPGGAWTELPVPVQPMPEGWTEIDPWEDTLAGANSVVAHSKDDIWITAGGALLHTRPRPAK